MASGVFSVSIDPRIVAALLKRYDLSEIEISEKELQAVKDKLIVRKDSKGITLIRQASP